MKICSLALMRLFTGALLLLALAGCNLFPELRDDILKRGAGAIEQVNKTAENVTNQIQKTKESVEKKVEDVQKAIKEVNEAVDAVNKVTE